MKKSLLTVGAAFVAAMVLTGCATKGTHGEVAEKFREFQEAVAQRPAAYVFTGERSVDEVGKLSAEVYDATIKYLNEYIKATENNRYYIGFMNDVQEVAKEKKITTAQAMAEVLADYKKADSEATNPEDKIYNKVIEGYRAVQALKPANKLKELAPIAIRAGKVALQAKNVQNVIVKTYSTINFRDVNGMKRKVLVTGSIAKVLEQAYFDTRALEFLIDQYKRNQEMISYMQN